MKNLYDLQLSSNYECHHGCPGKFVFVYVGR